MHIDIVGSRIKIKFQYPPSTDIQYKLASIPGGNENKYGTVWSWPINMTVCLKAREMFPDLVIGDRLWEWAMDHNERAGFVRAAQGAQETDVRDPAELFPGLARYAPDLLAKISTRWYQLEGAKALSKAKRMILGDQPGLGKTYQAIAGALEAHYSEGNFSPLILVLAPQTVLVTTWEPTILDVVPGSFVYSMTGDRKQRQGMLGAVIEEYDADDDPGPRFVLGNPEMARITMWYKCTACGREWKDKKERKPLRDEQGNPVLSGSGEQLYELAMCIDDEHKKKRKHRLMEESSYEDMLQLDWDILILDESQKVLVTNSSSRVKMSMQRRGMARLRPDMMYALSGTPYRGRPQRLWGTLNWLDPQGHPSYRKWVDYHFNVMEHYNDEGYDVGSLQEDTEDAFLRAQGDIMLRRTKGEVADQLPPKQYTGWWVDPENQQPGGHGIWLEMEPAQRRAYLQMRDSAVAALDGGTLNAIGVLAEMTRLRQFSCSMAKMIAQGKDNVYVQPVLPSNKLNWCKEFLETLDGKVVIVSQFSTLLDMFGLVLGKRTEQRGNDWGKIVKITGAVPKKQRALNQRAFQEDPDTRIMLLNLQAGGVGIDLDAQCDDMIFLDEPYIPDDAEQAEDRIHRVSRNHVCTYHYLRSLGTIEENIARTTGGRDAVQKRLLDGSRGVEFARTLV